MAKRAKKLVKYCTYIYTITKTPNNWVDSTKWGQCYYRNHSKVLWQKPYLS